MAITMLRWTIFARSELARLVVTELRRKWNDEGVEGGVWRAWMVVRGSVE